MAGQWLFLIWADWYIASMINTAHFCELKTNIVHSAFIRYASH